MEPQDLEPCSAMGWSHRTRVCPPPPPWGSIQASLCQALGEHPWRQASLSHAQTVCPRSSSL